MPKCAVVVICYGYWLWSLFVASSVDIKKNHLEKSVAPTPQNTPINPAPITSTYRPNVDTISEDMETITTPGL